jgi:uncharacterized alkaline shock family protein YloU
MPNQGQPEAPGVVRQELGTLEVADQVFQDIVRRVVSDVGGVAAVGRSGGLFRRGSAAEAIHVERGLGEVAFSIGLSVSYDVRIPEMVDELRRRVKAAVEEATGYRARTINVTVEHILPPTPVAEQPAPPPGKRVVKPPPIPAPSSGGPS